MSDHDLGGRVPPAQEEAGRRRFSASNRYGLALTLVVLTYLQTLTVSDSLAAGAVIVLLQLVTGYVVLSVSQSRRIRHAAGIGVLVASVLVFSLLLGGLWAESKWLLAGLYLFNVVLFALLPVVILRHIFTRADVDGQTFLAALTAYLIIGMEYAYIYRTIERVQDVAFFSGGGTHPMSDFLFFSFVTLTTTGYGNLVPAASEGQTLAIVEMVMGQFFLAAVVAKIVTAWRPRWARQPGAGWDFAPPLGEPERPPERTDRG
ncbi:MAG TPA: ion channel [Nocardioides sp.]|uniref:potassium channel family protein n=1 Tax=Nocardioides sp. TaxID=35761 RepID=UPI002BA73A1B|nr:ion channel [Nocardioides sp.]HQR28000.1 ion channel [Nocardioides sp.]